MPLERAPWMQYSNLDDIPALRKSSGKVTIPAKLLLSDEAVTVLRLHLDTVGLDSRRFSHSAQEQRKFRVVYMRLLMTHNR